MNKSSTDQDEDILLDSFGQQILPIYTQICFGFAIGDAQLYPRILETLEHALDKIYGRFPWLAGCVINEGSTTSSTGVFKISTRGQKPHLFVKDLRPDSAFPSIEAVRLSGFPIDALDEDVVAPRKTLIEAGDASPPEVFLVQVTLITGGLLLTFIGHHQAMDGIGQDQIIRLFSKACRDEEFTDEELELINLTANNKIPLLDSLDELPPNLKYQIANKQTPQSQPLSPSPPDCTWAYFSFSKMSLHSLKSTATKTSPSSLVSTDDALSAFIWKSVTAARLAHLSPTTPSTFTRAVDVRQMLGISPMHPTFVQNMTYNTLTFRELVEMPLGVLASSLRSKIDPKTSTVVHDIRALATFLSHTPDKSCVNFAAKMKAASDVFFSSWAKMRCYEYDFGDGIGKAEVVRRTRSRNLTEGLMYLMPRSPSGEIGLVICLSERDMEALRGDEEFAEFAEWVR